MKLFAPATKKQANELDNENTDFEPENVPITVTSTPISPKTTATKTTSVNSRNMVTGVLNDSTNQPTKRPKQQRSHSEHSTGVLQHQDYCSGTKHKLSRHPTNSQCQKRSLLRYLFSTLSPKKSTNSLKTIFKNNTKMFPHFTEIQNNKYF